MSTKNKNRAKHLIHTLSIDHKASNKQIAKGFGRFVRELISQQRSGKHGKNYKSMDTLARCLQDEIDKIERELDLSQYEDMAALWHFWNNTQHTDNYTEHFLDGDEAIVITNDKTLQKNLDKVSSFND